MGKGGRHVSMSSSTAWSTKSKVCESYIIRPGIKEKKRIKEATSIIDITQGSFLFYSRHIMSKVFKGNHFITKKSRV